MRKIVVLLLAVFLLSFSACSNKVQTPADKPTDNTDTAQTEVQESVPPIEALDNFITENGIRDDKGYVLDCPDVAALIKEYDFTLAYIMMGTLSSGKTEFKLIKSADGIGVQLIDTSFTDNGLKMERTVIINPDGTFEYSNGAILDGGFLGIEIDGEILIETYTKEKTPVITSVGKSSSSQQLSDDAKTCMKNYIDLALDCYSNALSQEGLDITMADVGYTSYK